MTRAWMSWVLRVGVFSLGLVLAATGAIAAEDHPHDKGPHGGVVGGFGGKYHMEAARSGDRMTFYLLADDGKSSATIATHEGGEVALIIPGRGLEKVEIPAGVSFSEFSTQVAQKGKITATVKLKVEGKVMSGKFSVKDN